MKIKEEELSKIKEQQIKLQTVVNEIGLIESKKHQLLHLVGTINEEVEEFKKGLEKEYGSININLETGEYTEIENNSEIKEEDPSLV